MTLTKDEISSKIMLFVSSNAGCNVSTLVHGLAKQHRVSPSTISKVYQTLIFSEKNPDGVLIVKKPSGFRGGHEPFKIFLKQTDLKKQIDEILTLLEEVGNHKNIFVFPLSKCIFILFTFLIKIKILITKREREKYNFPVCAFCGACGVPT